MPQTSSQAAAAALEPNTAPPISAPQNAPNWRPAWGLPCSVSVEIPMPGFTVKDLLGLRSQSVIASQWLTTTNLPLKVNRELIAWCEFEVLGNRLAARLTELL